LSPLCGAVSHGRKCTLGGGCQATDHSLINVQCCGYVCCCFKSTLTHQDCPHPEVVHVSKQEEANEGDDVGLVKHLHIRRVQQPTVCKDNHCITSGAQQFRSRKQAPWEGVCLPLPPPPWLWSHSNRPGLDLPTGACNRPLKGDSHLPYLEEIPSHVLQASHPERHQEQPGNGTRQVVDGRLG
jgi:hypothetical protein